MWYAISILTIVIIILTISVIKLNDDFNEINSKTALGNSKVELIKRKLSVLTQMEQNSRQERVVLHSTVEGILEFLNGDPRFTDFINGKILELSSRPDNGGKND